MIMTNELAMVVHITSASGGIMEIPRPETSQLYMFRDCELEPWFLFEIRLECSPILTLVANSHLILIQNRQNF